MRAQPKQETVKRQAPSGANGSLVVGGGLWRWLIVGALMLHGLVHMVGFADIWGLGSSGTVARVPTIPGGLSAGSPVVLAFGALWLIAMFAFLTAAVGIALHTAWWHGVVAGAAALSLVLCVAWWNDAVMGVIINVVILVGLAIQVWATRTQHPKGSLT